MNRYISLLTISMFGILMCGCDSGDGNAGLTENQQNLVAQRIAPVGSVVKTSDLNSVSPAASMSVAVTKVSLSEGSEHIVKMLNAGDGGNMIFEPAVIKISKGDTIHFKAVDMSHNSAAIDALIPSGAATWAGMMSQDVSVTLDVEGVYVYQCDPHAMMAMIGVVQVGDAVNMNEIQGAAEQYKSNFMMNADRLTTYLAQL